MNLREFIGVLINKGMVKKISKPIDVKFEIAAVMKQLDGTPLIFDQVKGFSMPVIANICSTRELVALGLEIQKKDIISHLAQAIDSPQNPSVIPATGYQEIQPDLTQLPILTYYPFDGGPYIASAIVVAHDPEHGLNASYHRMMVIGKNEVVLRILPRHFHEYLSRGLKEFAI